MDAPSVLEVVPISWHAKTSVLVIYDYPLHLKSPFFLDVLLSCRHGAFYWAPLLGAGLVGLIFASLRDGWSRVLLIVVIAQVYLIGALGLAGSGGAEPLPWALHWAGGSSFGMRYLTECAPMLAVGLAWLVRVLTRIAGLRTVLLILVIGVVWNGFLILAYGLGTISRSDCVGYSGFVEGIGMAVQKLAIGAI